MMTLCDKAEKVERHAFEKWMSDNGLWPKAVEKDYQGNYKLLSVSSAWTVWQARAAMSAEILKKYNDTL